MTEQSKNPQPGYATHAYPLGDLTRPLPPLTAFQSFVAAARLGSISRAADHLCRTQGAVSRQVQQLESHYRCALFVRHASGLTLTAEGSELLTVAVSVLTQLVQHADVHAKTASIVTLRLPSTFAIRWLLPQLADINHALPGTELRISTSADDTPDFTAPDVDAIVMRGTGQWAGMDAVPLFAEQLTPMCTSEMAASLGSAADLAHVTLLHPGHGHEEWQCWLESVGARQIDASRGLVFDTLELTLTAAAEGHGVAIGDPRIATHPAADSRITWETASPSRRPRSAHSSIPCGFTRKLRPGPSACAPCTPTWPHAACSAPEAARNGEIRRRESVREPDRRAVSRRQAPCPATSVHDARS